MYNDLNTTDAPTQRILIIAETIARYGPITLAQLTERLQFSRGAIWRAVNTMRNQGWVRMRLGDNAYEMRSAFANMFAQCHHALAEIEMIEPLMTEMAKAGAVYVDLCHFTQLGECRVIETNRKELPTAALSLCDDDLAGDVLDLTGLTDREIIYDQTDPTWNGTTSGSGVATYVNTAGETVTINFSEIESVVVCFVAGTMIETADGERAIDALQVGDLVRTADHDYQPIRWIGSSKVAAIGKVAPILIKAGALGNTRDLRVSPQHRMLLGGWQAEMLFGDDEVLVAAKHLVNDTTILRDEGGEVEYFHMMFDTHEIVFAEGAPSESFHPGQEGWGALAEEARAEILALFPELEDGRFEGYGASARRTLRAHEAKTAVDFIA